MSVESKHSSYEKYHFQWSRTQDVLEGNDGVKNSPNHKKYLPPLSGQNRIDYEAYEAGAYLHNITARTVNSMVGLAFMKEPVVEARGSIEELIKNITNTGVSLVAFSRRALRETFVFGRFGVLVDYPPVDGPRTIADLERDGIRPYMVGYRAEQIINWFEEVTNGRSVLTEVHLRETGRARGESGFQEMEHLIHLRLTEGIYEFIRYSRKKGQFDWEEDERRVPLVNSQPMNFIPFYFIGAHNNTPSVDRSPIIDLVDLNLSHYRSTADLEHGAHLTGLPTPVVSGVDDEEFELKLGSSEGIVLPMGGDAKFMEFTGSGLAALENRISKKEEQMAALGARLLNPDSNINETATAARIHRSGEVSVLGQVANNVSMALNQALALIGDWRGGGEAKIDINTEYIPKDVNPQILAALMGSVQTGDFTYRDLHRYLQEVGLTDDTQTFEEWKEELDSQGPTVDFEGVNIGERE